MSESEEEKWRGDVRLVRDGPWSRVLTTSRGWTASVETMPAVAPESASTTHEVGGCGGGEREEDGADTPEEVLMEFVGA